MGFLEEHFVRIGSQAHEHAIPHWAGGLGWLAVGMTILTRPEDQRHNLFGGAKAAHIAFWLILLGEVIALQSHERFLHSVHHVSMMLGFQLAAATSILERKGYTAMGSSNLVLAAASLQTSALMVGHPSWSSVATRGHCMAAFCGCVSSAFIPFVTWRPWVAVLASFFLSLEGWIWIGLGFFWCRDFVWWGMNNALDDHEQAYVDEHGDIMLLHLFTGMGMFVLCGVIILHWNCGRHDYRYHAYTPAPPTDSPELEIPGIEMCKIGTESEGF